MIVKNEARNIVRAIRSARKVADEIIVVDTGSTDETRTLLSAINQPFSCIEWRDSFAEARNESISMATKPWIMWLDADDVITDACATRINIMKKRPTESVYMFSVTNVDTEMKEEIGDVKTFMQMRMFPNDQGIVFSGRVHEQPAGQALARLKLVHVEDVIIEHHGYSNVQHQKESLRRNIRLQMIDLGFPANKDFFTFAMGEQFYCLYSPRTLAIWYKHIYIGSLDPFESGCPESHDERFDKMKGTVIDYLTVYASGLRVCNNNSNIQLLADVETVLEKRDFNVCPVA